MYNDHGLISRIKIIILVIIFENHGDNHCSKTDNNSPASINRKSGNRGDANEARSAPEASNPAEGKQENRNGGISKRAKSEGKQARPINSALQLLATTWPTRLAACLSCNCLPASRPPLERGRRGRAGEGGGGRGWVLQGRGGGGGGKGGRREGVQSKEGGTR